MPELPDIAVYIECLERRIAGETLASARVGHPFAIGSNSLHYINEINRLTSEIPFFLPNWL